MLLVCSCFSISMPHGSHLGSSQLFTVQTCFLGFLGVKEAEASRKIRKHIVTICCWQRCRGALQNEVRMAGCVVKKAGWRMWDTLRIIEMQPEHFASPQNRALCPNPQVIMIFIFNMKIANWGCTSFFDSHLWALLWRLRQGWSQKKITNDLGAKFDLWNSKSETLGQGH